MSQIDTAFGPPDRQVIPPDLQEVDLSAVRLHGMAVRWWCYRHFTLSEGSPVPVVYASPMDAFAEFKRLYNTPNGPYSYLKAPAIAGPKVWPENTVTPLISINFLGLTYRPDLSAASRVNRYNAWVSVSSAAQGMVENELGGVQQTNYAQAFDFSFQLDMWCQKPNTQAVLIEQLLQAFRSTAAGVMQTWVPVPYPKTHGNQLVRLRIEDGPRNMTESVDMAPEAKTVLYRTSCTVLVEGYRPDRTRVIVPTVWYFSLGIEENLSPADLNTLYVLNNYDLRQNPNNPVVKLRQTTMPPVGGSYIGVGSLTS